MRLACMVAIALVVGMTASGGRSAATTSLVGVRATYAVRATQSEAQVAAFASTSGVRNVTEARDTTQYVSVEVTAVTAGVARILTVTEIDRSTRTAAYDVPVSTLYRQVPEAPSLVNLRSHWTVHGGSAIATQESARASDGWVRELQVDLTSPKVSAYRLHVALLQASELHTRGRSGSALFIVPTLIAPQEGRRLVSALPGPTQPRTSSGGRLASPHRAVVATAYSRLSTYDNPAANLLLWYSDLTLTGTFDTNAASYTAFYEYRAVSPNWLASAYVIEFKDISVSEGTAEAWSEFFGIFPLGPCVLWLAEPFHRITINASNHRVWLQGHIDTFCVMVAPFIPIPPGWHEFKDGVFYSGQTYPNDGSRQDASWFVVP